MCGITGIYNFGHDKPVDERLLRRMNELLHHRGPDDAGLHLEENIGLAMSRLSIIDLSSGHQPMLSEDGNLCLVFNGEIYNFQELKEELIKKGHHFKSNSDTEVILHLYQEHGTKCLSYLRGMFAFALWDKIQKRLMLARDRVGKKPLFYFVESGQLAWASEIRPLLEVPGVSKEINLPAIDLFLSLQYIPSPQTIFKSIKKLPPAHFLILERGVIRVERYWDLPLIQNPLTMSLNEAQEEIRREFKEATRLRMISDVPLGAFLSGGVDSAAVVAMMSQLSSKPIKTFSIGFEEQDYSELGYARETAIHFGTEHTEFVVKPEMTDVLPKLAIHYGEPFGDSSALPTYYVARETRNHVKVALNGDGGDEAFGGYRRYEAMKILSYIPKTLREKIAPALYFRFVGIFKESQRHPLYTSAFRDQLGTTHSGEAYIRQSFEKAKNLDYINQLLYVDFSTYLPECLMTKVDIATMANSLEGRSPFLDHRFMEFAFRLPGKWKVNGFQKTKWIFKEAFKDILPASVLTRRKMGFGIPIHAWFRGRLKNYWKDHVLSPTALRRGYFQESVLRRMYDDHLSGARDHGYRMWQLLMLELWHTAFGV